VSPEADAVLQSDFPRPVSEIHPAFELAFRGEIVHLPDVLSADSIAMRTEAGAERMKRVSAARGFRSFLFVPLITDRGTIGMISVTRKETGPFAQQHIDLLKTFASQAVIAIQNVGLFNEVQAKTRDLEESLQQQTATSEVLQVISASQGELAPVFAKLLENATRVCGANFGYMNHFANGEFRRVASYNMPEETSQTLPRVVRHHPQGVVTTVARTRRPMQIADVRAAVPFAESDPTALSVAASGARTLFCVPMLKDDELLGTISIYRQEVLPFTDRQVELVTSFARQAVIAIENARLINETREALEQQTATAEVLETISSSPGDLQPVFAKLLENAVRVCGANFGILNLWDGERFNFVADHNVPAAFAAYRQRTPLYPWSGATIAEVVRTHQVAQTSNLRETPGYAAGIPHVVGMADVAGARTLMTAPMLKDGELLGAFTIFRQEVRPFTDKQIELVENFSKQAVIAIENTRLLKELQARTHELSQSLDDLRSAQDRLVQTEKLASLGQLTAGIAHEIKNPLNFVNNFAALSTELIDEMNEGLAGANIPQEKREGLEELAQMLKGNLEKVVQHGRRADSIVKNMLLHSREGSGERRPADINALVDESLNLAYHGARAEKPGLQITLQRKMDPAAGSADIYPQEITRVLLNVISNGFYAATKRAAAAGNGFDPTLVAETRNHGDRVEIRIRDNGSGMTADVKSRIFTPFFTTKPPGEGTGLGLSMSHDIVVKQHGGVIDVETEAGSFTEFIITLPRRAGGKKL
jgi:signal transduction histidine kinase